MTTQTPRLIPRAFDSDGRLQMAEGSPEGHSTQNTSVKDLFIVHHYAQPTSSAGDAIQLRDQYGERHRIGYRELKELPSRTVTAVLECAGNGRGLLAERVPGNQFGLGLFGQGTWRGVSLADVLSHAALSGKDWTTMVVTAEDEGVTQPEDSRNRFAKGIPRSKALHPDTILAWELNGRPIPGDHGGPLRLVVPGWYGIWWVKWLRQIELRDTDFHGFWQNERYTYQSDDGAILSVVEEQLPRAVLLSPREGQRIRGDKTLDILAWAGEATVQCVHVTVDDGVTWAAADLTTEHGPWGWTHWTANLPRGLPYGLRRIAVRATDNADRTQDWQPKRNRLGYGNNGIHVVQVDLTAQRPTPG